MTDSLDFDDRQPDAPGLRVGGWVPQPQGATPSAPAAPKGRHRAADALTTGVRPAPPRPLAVQRRPAYALILAAVAIIALALLVMALPFVRSSSPVVAPSADTAAPVAEELPPDPTPEPSRSFSPAPVSLNTRASKSPPAPTRKATPTGRATSTRPTPPASPKPPPPLPPGELAPLPAAQEPALRSSGGGPETFIDFVNARSAPVTVYWLDYDGQRQQYAVLQPGQGYRQHTYVGHPWVATGSDGRALVCFQPTTTVGTAVVR